MNMWKKAEVVVTSTQQELRSELGEMEAQWEEEYVECGPFRFQQVSAATSTCLEDPHPSSLTQSASCSCLREARGPQGL